MLQHSHQTGHQPISFLALQPQRKHRGTMERKQWTPSLKTWSLLSQHRKMSHVHCADLMVWQSSSVCQPTKLFSHWLYKAPTGFCLFQGKKSILRLRGRKWFAQSHTKKSNCWNWHSLLTLSGSERSRLFHLTLGKRRDMLAEWHVVCKKSKCQLTLNIIHPILSFLS